MAHNYFHSPVTQRIPTNDFLLDLAFGNNGATPIAKFGHNPTVGSSLEDIWDGAADYEYPAAAGGMWISSDDQTNDVALTFTVEGIDKDSNFASVTGTLDGTDARTMVPVLSGGTDDEWLRVFRVFATSNTAATGNIYVSKDNTDAGGNGIPDTVTDIQAKIIIGNEQTLMCMFTIPTGNTGYLLDFEASTGLAKLSEVNIYIREPGKTFRIQHAISINASFAHHDWMVPLTIPAGSDIKVRGLSAGGGGAISAGFELFYH